MDKAQEAANLFVGLVDLTAFTTTEIRTPKARMVDGTKSRIEMLPDYFVRQINEFSWHRLPPPMPVEFEPLYELYDFYAVRINSKAFFTQQVRINVIIKPATINIILALLL